MSASLAASPAQPPATEDEDHDPHYPHDEPPPPYSPPLNSHETGVFAGRSSDRPAALTPTTPYQNRSSPSPTGLDRDRSAEPVSNGGEHIVSGAAESVVPSENEGQSEEDEERESPYQTLEGIQRQLDVKSEEIRRLGRETGILEESEERLRNAYARERLRAQEDEAKVDSERIVAATYQGNADELIAEVMRKNKAQEEEIARLKRALKGGLNSRTAASNIDSHEETPVASTSSREETSSPSILWTPLHEAAIHGTLSKAKLLLLAGEDPLIPYAPRDETDITTGYTALHFASNRGHAHVVELLLSLPYVSPDGPDLSVKTPLVLASRKGYHETVQVLLQKGADFRIPVEKHYGYSALHYAAGNGHVKVVEYLLESGCPVDILTSAGSSHSPIPAWSRLGWTPLHTACFYGRYAVVALLLAKGADFEAKNADGNHPLHLASARGFYQVCALLIDHGANVEVVNNGGHTPLSLAAHRDHIRNVKLLLSKGANIRTTSKEQWAPLHWSSFLGYPELVELLLGEAPDLLEAKEVQGRTALLLACQNGRFNAAKMLLSGGANINAKANNGFTALHLATQKGHLDLVQHIISGGADINARDKSGWTALDHACWIGDLRIIMFLVDQNVVISSTDIHHSSPLHIAIASGNVEAVKLLIHRGADIAAKNKLESALTIARNRGKTEMVKYMESITTHPIMLSPV